MHWPIGMQTIWAITMIIIHGIDTAATRNFNILLLLLCFSNIYFNLSLATPNNDYFAFACKKKIHCWWSSQESKERMNGIREQFNGSNPNHWISYELENVVRRKRHIHTNINGNDCMDDYVKNTKRQKIMHSTLATFTLRILKCLIL